MFDGFDILAGDSNEFKVFIRETLFTKLDMTILKRTVTFFPLELHD